jgi:uncharacterized phage-associated protein
MWILVYESDHLSISFGIKVVRSTSPLTLSPFLLKFIKKDVGFCDLISFLLNMENITEQKILNAIRYFVRNARNVGLTKLLKLLYFLDFMYYKKHGLSVTLFDYQAFDFGPVPRELYESIKTDNLPDYLRHEVFFDKQMDDTAIYPSYKIRTRKSPIDFSWFSPYEKKMLEEVAEIFYDADAKTMTEISHLKNSPWDLTLRTKGKYQLIEYDLAVDSDSSLDPATMKEYLELQRELKDYGRR